ncbi:hypothetical protein [Neobacillus thermocopriae]|uniref:Uncharacterized protein n=1 Tax=Neobacillus thermocopriae TaxID=1215031 RepID=A0A6B3TTZ7_9BACI|nr:hypothetical protein [Neobacillus thermocopriae]MED3625568.1 hypothetical protein [Neobacillus thermocopriae]MED3712705.1 hypothetical protein [Neobacillus thermocopriae]NEX80162.1 hypothetical protein [Neobacillus thermocopriae]
MRRRMPFHRLFRPKRRNRGSIWASVLSIGLSALVYGLTRGKGKKTMLPSTNAVKHFAPKLNREGVTNAVKNMVPPNLNINRMDNAALTEFSDELIKNAMNKKQ